MTEPLDGRAGITPARPFPGLPAETPWWRAPADAADDDLGLPAGPHFVEAVSPLLRRARLGIADALAADPAIGDPRAIEQALTAHVARRLTALLHRAFLLELHVARLEDRLDGTTPGERFDSFRRLLEDPAFLDEIFPRYPALARQLPVVAHHATAAVVEMLTRLRRDRPLLEERWGPLGDLTGVRTGLGDSHRHGRSVAFLDFADGPPVVYKPRSLAVEVHFNALLAWLGEHGFRPALRTVDVLDRGTHGWVEVVEAGDAPDAAAVRRFFERQGGLLAVLYLLDASDFHFENLIAAGEHPVLVDLETLFHPTYDQVRPAIPAPVGHSIYRTVLNTGLLPQRFWADSPLYQGVDLSGFAANSGEQTAVPVLSLADPGTDAMRLEKRLRHFPRMRHRVRLHGEEVAVGPHRDALLTGFDRMLRLLREEGDALGRPGGPLDAFADDEVRVVMRPTRAYDVLLFEAAHPDLLQDETARRELLRSTLEPLEVLDPRLAGLTEAEIADLDRYDIPYFSTRPSGRDLVSTDGKRLEGLFPTPALDRVRRKLDTLDEAEHARQHWLVSSSLAALETSVENGPPPTPSYDFAPGREPASPADLLRHAAAAADRLAALAFSGPDGAVTWYSTAPIGTTGKWSLEALDNSLYYGLPGLALSLAYLGRVLDRPDLTGLARGAWKAVEHRLERPVDELGVFTGRGGIPYVRHHLAVLWGDDAQLDRAAAEALVLADDVAVDTDQDVIGGSAGLAVVLLDLHERRPDPALAALATACGERLLSRRHAVDPGYGWIWEPGGSRPLLGLAHGAGGIAWALLRLAAATGREDFRDTARGALAYERSRFDAEAGNWPDLREGRPEDRDGEVPGAHFMTAWCQGAPGVGLSRVAMSGLLDDPLLHREIDTAVEHTLGHGFGGNLSLCHGDLGNLELPLAAARRRGDAELSRDAYRYAAGVLRGVEDNGWLYGLPVGLETVGLMAGLAGIALQLLRLAAPDRVPSVLTLDPPPG